MWIVVVQHSLNTTMHTFDTEAEALIFKNQVVEGQWVDPLPLNIFEERSLDTVVTVAQVTLTARFKTRW